MGPCARTAVGSTAEPAFAVQLDGEIIAWNEAAENLLGYSAHQALGRTCFEVLKGRDVFGNAYCVSGCPLAVMARRRESAVRFEVIYRSAAGADVPTLVTPLALPHDGGEDLALVHLLQRKELGDLTGAAHDRDDAGAARDLVHRLTPREIEILRLLAAGASTREIADRLFISRVTVRNHVENLLRKLSVHSRLQAVALAHRSGLL